MVLAFHLRLGLGYVEKLSLIDGMDPFLGVVPGPEVKSDLPSLDASNVTIYSS